MRKNIFRKGMIILILTILIGTVIFHPITGMKVEDAINNEDKILKDSRDTDWWPMYRNDPGNTGYSQSIAPQSNILVWMYNISHNTYSPNPTIVDNKVYVSTNDGLYCFNAENGSFLWRFHTTGVIHGSSAIDDGKVYISSVGKLFCLNAETGNEYWNCSLHSSLTSPIVVGEKLYVTSDGSYYGTVNCFRVDNSDLIWNYDVEHDFFIGEAPAYYDGKIYFVLHHYSSSESVLRCLDADDGAFQWDYPIGYTFYGTSPAVVNGRAYVSGIEEGFDYGVLYCINADTGSLIWEYSSSSGEWPTSNDPPAISGNYALFSTDKLGEYGTIYCINTTDGSKIWKKNGGYVQSSPIIADNKVYCAIKDGGENGNLLCLGLHDGSFIWNYYLHHDLNNNAPSVANGRLYMVDGKGTVYAFEDEPNDPPDTPERPEGNIYGKTNTEYTYSSSTVDSDPVDLIYYMWDWGDGEFSVWVGPYHSGETCSLSHTWTDKGSYEIRVKAKDNYDNESGWSVPLEIYLTELTLNIKNNFVFITAEIENTGDYQLDDVDWSFSVTGGILKRINKQQSDTIPVLPAGGKETISSGLIFGLGRITVTVTAVDESKTASGLVIGPFIFI